MEKENKIPRHIAIIMDGNGRWAKKRNLPRTEGHRRGIRVVEEMIEEAARLGVEVLSLYTFSTENWKRPRKEIDMLLGALENFLKSRVDKLIKNNLKLRTMGEVDKFPPSIRKLLDEVKDKTKNNTGLVVNLALNYGARSELLKAIKELSSDAIEKKLDINNLDEKLFSSYLYTKDLPDPDLLIRTSGEMRISNFMLWQLSYAELYFSEKFWPEFAKDDLNKAIEEFQKRERRFGDINANT